MRIRYRAEPGTRLLNQMIEASQELATEREATEEKAEAAFYERMHDRYGMTKPGIDAEGQCLPLAEEAVVRAPVAGALQIDDQIKFAAVGQLVGLVSRSGSATAGVSQ
jgi:hypothetical protein